MTTRVLTFGRFRTIVDVGGGNGALLAGVLAANPKLEGTVFDLPHVVQRAPALLAQAKVASRCRVVGGSFFESVPEGADAYILRAVIHDWSDEDSIRILSVVRRAIGADGVLLLIERVIAPPNEGRDVKFSDLNMLVGPGGRERSREEYAAIFEASGFRLGAVVPAGAHSLFEAAPANGR